MTEKQKIFIREYLKDFNGTRAYKAAYPDCSDESARRLASKLLTKDDIQKAIREQADKTLEEVEIDVAYIVNNIKIVTERCMKQDEYGKFDANNSLKGLELLGKYKNIFKENVDLNVKSSKKLKDVFNQIGGEGLDE